MFTGLTKRSRVETSCPVGMVPWLLLTPAGRQEGKFSWQNSNSCGPTWKAVWLWLLNQGAPRCELNGISSKNRAHWLRALSGPKTWEVHVVGLQAVQHCSDAKVTAKPCPQVQIRLPLCPGPWPLTPDGSEDVRMKRWVQEGQKVPRTPGNCRGVCGEERSPWALFSLHVDMRHHCCRRSVCASVQALALERGAKRGEQANKCTPHRPASPISWASYPLSWGTRWSGILLPPDVCSSWLTHFAL